MVTTTSTTRCTTTTVKMALMTIRVSLATRTLLKSSSRRSQKTIKCSLAPHVLRMRMFKVSRGDSVEEKQPSSCLMSAEMPVNPQRTVAKRNAIRTKLRSIAAPPPTTPEHSSPPINFSSCSSSSSFSYTTTPHSGLRPPSSL
ncbi:hypothetical protein GCK72_011691 [Caenorhabditis remanei]|uniref:Uncharacterized protein n=1 Tax=Caenorhabditis remanei TaxID=31234 RepID=A0A6A5H8H1_CAERE|nr:hypothetical protein GCK72_011691 [Caenorhabditis remanei]KAF1763425.1 hypothetical protein GCK72_011691 [Caenorhabditis remanei]